MLFHIPLCRDLGLVLNQTHPYSLHLEGCDIIGQVPIESIAITEAGPGGVSSMSFSVDDSTSVLTISDGAEVRMWDYTRDLPMFFGWVESVSVTAWAAVGRTYQISAYGIESLLDTVIIPSMTRTSSDEDDQTNALASDEVLQVLAANAGLRVGKDSVSSVSASSLSKPIADTLQYLMSYTPTVVLDGMTIRNAIQAFMDACNLPSPDPVPMFLSVDFWGGVRWWSWLGNWSTSTYASFPNVPSDYATITIDNSATGAISATELSYERDMSPGAMVNAVYVKGGSAAGTGWVVGDTTTGRHEAYVTSSATNQFMMAAAASSLMAAKSKVAGRGSLRLEQFTPVNAHPGGPLVITDTLMGWASQKALITQIDKTMVPGTLYQDWTISFALISHGASAGAPSAVRYARTLTRGTN